MKSEWVDGAPRAIGPYCHAAVAGNLVFCSGQTPLDPETGRIVGDEVATQTRQVLTNLSVVLEGVGSSLGSVVKTTVYLATMGDFEAMNGVYAAAFGDHRPARTTIAVRENPLGALVEIECVAEVAED